MVDIAELDSSDITVEERLLIQELVSRYCWALDTGDADGYVGCFTRDGWIEHFPPKRYVGEEIREMVTNLWYGRPYRFMGRQHQPHNLLLERVGDTIHAQAMWQVTRLLQQENRFETFLLGHWEAVCAREGGRWRFKSLQIKHWFRHEAPWVGDPKARLVLPGDENKKPGEF
ncbi:MAG TPA: nuclear transport factor 2 family protein [Hyphomicrobiales bacterium]|nr:nuclear transport factor 2 family protein [Hyphomicrobiales bacterium]